MGIDIYAEEIVSHYEHPHNKRRIDDANASFHEYNPICGDDVTVYLKIENGKITDASFEGEGCAISIGTSSMLTDELKGKETKAVEKMGFEDIVVLLGIDPGPARLKCATLSLKATQNALKNYKK